MGKERLKNMRKVLNKISGSLWIILLIDTVIAAMYVGLFYDINYLMPNEESGTYTIISSAASTTTANATANTTDTTEATTMLATDTMTSTSSSGITNWSETFADKFTDTIVSTDTSYSSPNISITLEEKTIGSGSAQVKYYIADIYVADITCFQTALAKDTYGTGYKDTIANMSSENNAILATNGDYYSFSKEGVVIRNGVVYRSTVTGADVCILYYDGTMKTIAGSEFNVDDAIADGAYQAWTFGPALLDSESNAISEFDASKRLQGKNPRTVIGYYEPGHYCLITVDGRDEGDSTGMTLTQLSQLMEDLGCTSAYNLDGGKSSVMTYNSEVVNNPVNGGRQTSDSIIIKEVSEE